MNLIAILAEIIENLERFEKINALFFNWHTRRKII